MDSSIDIIAETSDRLTEWNTNVSEQYLVVVTL